MRLEDRIKMARNKMTKSSRRKASARQIGVQRKRQLTSGQIEWLTSHATLDKWVGLSLEERLVMFHRQYPEKKITIYRLRKAYREAGIKLKKIQTTKIVTKGQKAKIEMQLV